MADRIPLVISGTSIREIPSSDRLDVQGALEVNGHITPGADSAYDIGTSSLKFRDIHLSAGTIHLGGVKLRADGNKLTVQDSTGAQSSITSASIDIADNDDNFRSNVAGVLSVIDAGGLGSFTFDSATAKFTYTGGSDADIRGKFSGGEGISYNSSTGAIAIDTTDSVTFGGLTVSGNLTVTGTTVTNSSTNTVITDKLIELGNGTTGTPSGDIGIVFERGDENNAFIGFDESLDKFIVGTGTFTGASTGDLTITNGTIVAATFEGNLQGNADTASRLDSAGRTFALTGDVTGSITSDLGGGFSIATTIAANAVSSDELNSASTLTIKNTAGTTLKTVIGAGA